jgi:hypothetical protein
MARPIRWAADAFQHQDLVGDAEHGRTGEPAAVRLR